MATLVPAPVRRPASVTFAVVLVWIYAILTALVGVLALIAAFDKNTRERAIQDILLNENLNLDQAEQLVANARNVFIVAGVIILIVALLAALAASGLARGANGWRIFLLIVLFLRWVPEVFELRFVDVQAAQAYQVNIAGTGAYIVLVVIIIWLLFNRKANVFFAHRDQPTMVVPAAAPAPSYPPSQPASPVAPTQVQPPPPSPPSPPTTAPPAAPPQQDPPTNPPA